MDGKKLKAARDRARSAKDATDTQAHDLLRNSARLRRVFDTAPSNREPVQIPPAFLMSILAGTPSSAPVTLPPAVFTRLSELWNSPNGQGWLRLCELLQSAAKDPLVKASKPASDFLDLMTELASDALSAGDEMEALRPLVSVLASSTANARHAKAGPVREWVVAEWAKTSADYLGNKSAFARDYSRRCSLEMGHQVLERTIRERWLKGK